MEYKKHLKILGGVLVGAIAIGVGIVSANALKGVIEVKKGK